MKQPESKPFMDVSATGLNAFPVYPALVGDHVATGRTNRSCVYTLHTSCCPGKITQTNSQEGKSQQCEYFCSWLGSWRVFLEIKSR